MPTLNHVNSPKPRRLPACLDSAIYIGVFRIRALATYFNTCNHFINRFILLGDFILKCRLIIFNIFSSVTRLKIEIIVSYHSLMKGFYIILQISSRLLRFKIVARNLNCLCSLAQMTTKSEILIVA